MNLTARINRNRVSKYLLATLLISFLPNAFGPIQTASAAPATSLSANTNEAKCASTASDTSSAKLDVILDGNYCVLRFLSSTNTWTPPSHLTSFRFLAVGGGGAGGWGRGGGGGAGGFYESTTTVSQSAYSISVGAGGVATSSTAPSGDPTSLGSITVGGGGGGGGHPYSTPSAVVNGSGGGSGMNYGTLNPAAATTSITLTGVFSNNGAAPKCAATSACSDDTRNTGGGGGAGSDGYGGKDGTSTGGYSGGTLTEVGDRPDGGEGKSSSITGVSKSYAGGGGGSVAIHVGEYGRSTSPIYKSASFGRGKAGGGDGYYPTSSSSLVDGTSAQPNTGSGGGGGGDGGGVSSPVNLGTSRAGGNGGSGIVIIRFQLPTFTNDASECISGVANTSASVLDYSTVSGDCLLVFSTPDSVTSGTNSWTVPIGVETVSAVLVGGGGGAGSKLGGGGGGGQVIDSTTVPLVLKPGTTYTLTIGNGGVTRGVISTYSAGGTNGEASSITSSGFSVKALGGGGAAGDYQSTYSYADNTGWSTGGEGMQLNWSSGVSITSVNANNYPVGGAAYKGGIGGQKSFNYGGGGGGGGAGGAGGNAYYNSYSDAGGGNGAPGITTTILGYPKCFGGGGGGGADQSAGSSNLSTATCGGAGGVRNSTAVSNATPDTGGGGGGGGTSVSTSNGGRGATGLIILRFKLANPTGASQSLNMACHSFANGTTTIAQSKAANYFGSRFATDSATSEFSFPSASDTTTIAKTNWGTGAPSGCGNGSNFTVYLWGYMRSPSATETISARIFLQHDLAIKLRIDGVDLAETSGESGAGNTTCDSTGQNSGSTPYQTGYDCGSAIWTEGSSNYISFPANSWHFVEIWLHERDTTNPTAYPLALNASASLVYINERRGIFESYPRSLLSQSVPRTISASYTTNPATTIPTLTASVDTASAVTGSQIDSTTSISKGGKFSFYESGTALSSCQNITSVNGSASCNLDTVTASKRYFKVIFTPDSSSVSTDLQYNVYARTIWEGVVLVGKVKNATLKIGQYDAFPGISTYPLNVYADGTIYGALTRTLTDTGTAGCALDATRFFLTATKVGTCTVAVNAAGDASHYSETTTAIIYWIQFRNNFVTQVASVPTQIALSGQVQITKYAYDTLTVTSFKNADGSSVITSASVGQTIRIYGTGFLGSDVNGVVHLGGNNDLYWTYSEFSVNTSDASANYIQLTIPVGTISDKVGVEFTNKGVVYSADVLTITS